LGAGIYLWVNGFDLRCKLVHQHPLQWLFGRLYLEFSHP
jgi:hypothetical protein